MKKKPKRGKEISFEVPFKHDYEKQIFDGLLKGLREFSPDLSEEEMLTVAKYCSYHEYEKDAVIVDIGEVCEHVYFTVKGTVTAVDNRNGKDHHYWFMTEGDVVISVNSYFSEYPSKERLIALKEFSCIALPKKDLITLSKQFPSFMDVRVACLEHYYDQSMDRNKWINMTAEEKYQQLKLKYPHLLKEENVTNTALASFLGITRQHLLRIRKDLGK